MKDRYNILFVCTGNSARSIMAEAVANRLGGERMRAFSAGSHPQGHVHRGALQVLDAAGLATSGLRSKSWEEFAAADAPVMDLVITVCDRAAAEACPHWPGHPVTAHWSVPDPAAVEGSPEQVERAFSLALQMLHQRISLLLSLRPGDWDRLAIESLAAMETNA
ncbi:arsenate reductase ArsC [Luteimonas sp. MC1825]|uniref:arsenate reductase ArsC n=1 Tax=Luteimonas sp. MC1825 TaxID=2761107 RepID=UPI0016231721|nr:arsenate reductase ArsC [Luteimonas sp. MC1825]MBB6599191.1 arsenate reductase ArsC [Luteimonas sp. MC1825]QOC89312.1 arsenate reductase ArsC [Luteimonas sp. MC1825]